MTALEELVIRDREILQARKERDDAIELHKATIATRRLSDSGYPARSSVAICRILAPIFEREITAGLRANELWLKVLEEYGPGAAQDALRAAKGEK